MNSVLLTKSLRFEHDSQDMHSPCVLLLDGNSIQLEKDKLSPTLFGNWKIVSVRRDTVNI